MLELMHRHSALGAQPPSPITNKPLERPLNVVVGRVLAKRSVGQIGSALVQRIGNLLVHGRMVQRGFGFFNSHFFSVSVLSHVATVAALEV